MRKLMILVPFLCMVAGGSWATKAPTGTPTLVKMFDDLETLSGVQKAQDDLKKRQATLEDKGTGYQEQIKALHGQRESLLSQTKGLQLQRQKLLKKQEALQLVVNQLQNSNLSREKILSLMHKLRHVTDVRLDRKRGKGSHYILSIGAQVIVIPKEIKTYLIQQIRLALKENAEAKAVMAGAAETAEMDRLSQSLAAKLAELKHKTGELTERYAGIRQELMEARKRMVALKKLARQHSTSLIKGIDKLGRAKLKLVEIENELERYIGQLATLNKLSTNMEIMKDPATARVGKKISEAQQKIAKLTRRKEKLASLLQHTQASTCENDGVDEKVTLGWIELYIISARFTKIPSPIRYIFRGTPALLAMKHVDEGLYDVGNFSEFVDLIMHASGLKEAIKDLTPGWAEVMFRFFLRSHFEKHVYDIEIQNFVDFVIARCVPAQGPGTHPS